MTIVHASDCSTNNAPAITPGLCDCLPGLLRETVGALEWCSGSADFSEGGQARKGWEKVVAPLLKRCQSVLKEEAPDDAQA